MDPLSQAPLLLTGLGPGLDQRKDRPGQQRALPRLPHIQVKGTGGTGGGGGRIGPGKRVVDVGDDVIASMERLNAETSRPQANG